MNKTLHTKGILYTAYLLVFVGYMTLTLSLPLVGIDHFNLPVSSTQFQYGLTALFFLFSLSAIFLSRLADLIGTYTVLNFAQPTSILGLLLVALAPNNWLMSLGFCLMGAGTGCYASISRLLITTSVADPHARRKAFALFSIIIILAPLVSSFLMIHSYQISYRLAYFIMAAIETLMFLRVFFVLRHLPTLKYPVNFIKIMQGYVYCLKKRYFLLNMLFVGLSGTLIISIFLGNSHQFFMNHLHTSTGQFTLINFLIIASYIVGILVLRCLPKTVPFELIRAVVVMILLIASLWFYYAVSILGNALAIYLGAFTLGFLLPLSTSSGLEVIKKYHGASAALYTFSFAIISSLWSLIHNHLNFSVKHYLFIVFISTALIMLFMSIFTLFLRPPLKD